jgi:hypothetical protein
VGVTGKYGAPVSRAIAGSSGQLRVDLLASDHGDRHDRSAGAQRDLCKPAAPEALEPVTLAKRLARALRALREDSHELLLLEQPLGVAGGGDDSSQLPHRHGHVGKVERPVEDQEAGMAGQRMLVEDRERDHRGVPRKDSPVVRAQQCASVRGDVVDSGGLHPPPTLVEELEQRQGRPRELLVEPHSSST